jgi:hypothetical protein
MKDIKVITFLWVIAQDDNGRVDDEQKHMFSRFPVVPVSAQ